MCPVYTIGPGRQRFVQNAYIVIGPDFLGLEQVNEKNQTGGNSNHIQKGEAGSSPGIMKG